MTPRHIVEGHLRIEDHSTNSFATALAGYSFKTDGSYTDPFSSGSITDGHVGYIGADFGWNAWGDRNGSGIGALIGYTYWNDSPNTTRSSFTTAESSADVGYDQNTGATSLPMDSKPNNVDINLLAPWGAGQGGHGFCRHHGVVGGGALREHQWRPRQRSDGDNVHGPWRQHRFDQGVRNRHQTAGAMAPWWT